MTASLSRRYLAAVLTVLSLTVLADSCDVDYANSKNWPRSKWYESWPAVQS